MTQVAIHSAQPSQATGSICQAAGPYYSSRNAKVIVFVKGGQQFPPDADGANTTWTPLGGGSLNDGQFTA